MKHDELGQHQDTQNHQNPDDGPDSDDKFRANIVFLSFFGTGVILFACWAGLKDKPEYFWQVFITGTLSYLIFLAMFVQARVSKQQRKAMQDGLEQTKLLTEAAKTANAFTESSFYLAERAYLAIPNLHPTTTFGPDIKPTFGFIIENGGRTPAFYVSAVLYTAINETTDPVDWRRSPLAFFTTEFLMPSVSTERITMDSFHTLDEEQFEEMKIGRLFYFVKVRLEYWDIGKDGEKRWSDYIFNIHPIKGGVKIALSSNVLPNRKKTNSEDKDSH